MTSLGIQDRNWTELLGLVQMAQTLLSTFTLVTSAAQLVTQLSILRDVKAIRLGNLFGNDKGGFLSNFLGSSSLGFKTLGTKAGLTDGAGHLMSMPLSNGAGLMASGLIAGGLLMGFNDAATMSQGEGLDAGDLRGFFLGTGSKGKSTLENGLSVAGNTAKYTAIGAGIGTIIPGIGTAIGAGVGALIGLFTGLVGTTMEDNTEAVESNTDALENTNDNLRKSVINKLYQQYTLGEGGIGGPLGVGGADGSTAVGTPTNSYKYGVTSKWGQRTYYSTLKKKWITGHHGGVDFGFPQGTPVGAAQTGTVIGSASGYNGGAGQFIKIKGVDGFDYLYYHLHKRYANVGDKVTAGDLIALSGGNPNVDGKNAGESTGSHLHFQVNKTGTRQDVSPYAYVTSQLFNPGSAPTYNVTSGTTGNDMTATSNNLTYKLSKESLFSMASGATGQGGPTSEPVVANYATSSDVDRLIDVIREVNEVKQNQKELMQMLAGRNTFIYGKE